MHSKFLCYHVAHRSLGLHTILIIYFDYMAVSTSCYAFTERLSDGKYFFLYNQQQQKQKQNNC